jgi:RNA polymerase sigma-70 factor, ECF subfamily
MMIGARQVDQIEISPVDPFEEQRRPLLRLGYRMLGSIAEAEDMVQEAWLRWHAADRSSIDNPRAFLTTIVTRLCLDHLKSARSRRESYVGAWLPEPLIETGPLAASAHDAGYEDLAEDLSVALMLTLERLSPLERAAFLLHDVFDLDFDAVAQVLDRTNTACRRLAARARTHVRASPPRFAPSAEAGDALARAFAEASRSGDVAALQHLLTNDVVLMTDGGGKRSAAINPIQGSDKVARFFAGLVHKFRYGRIESLQIVRTNGLPGFITVEKGGVLQTTALEIQGDQIAGIYIVRNPDKLGHIGALAGLQTGHAD